MTLGQFKVLYKGDVCPVVAYSYASATQEFMIYYLGEFVFVPVESCAFYETSVRDARKRNTAIVDGREVISI